jgi:hypothetical protein
MTRRTRFTIGTLLLGAVIGFSPAARADTAQSTPPDAGVCMEDPGIALERAGRIQDIQSQLAAQTPPLSDGDGVQLNTRGYRYDADKGPGIARDLQLLDVEVRRARAAAKHEGRLP